MRRRAGRALTISAGCFAIASSRSRRSDARRKRTIAAAMRRKDIRRRRKPLRSRSAYHRAMELNLTAVFQKVPEGYIGFVEELPRANTQRATLEEARANLQEAVALVL